MLEKNRLSVARVITWMRVDDDCSGVYPLASAWQRAGHFGYNQKNTLLDVLNRGWRVWGENPRRGKPLTLWGWNDWLLACKLCLEQKDNSIESQRIYQTIDITKLSRQKQKNWEDKYRIPLILLEIVSEKKKKKKRDWKCSRHIEILTVATTSSGCRLGGSTLCTSKQDHRDAQRCWYVVWRLKSLLMHFSMVAVSMIGFKINWYCAWH